MQKNNPLTMLTIDTSAFFYAQFNMDLMLDHLAPLSSLKHNKLVISKIITEECNANLINHYKTIEENYDKKIGKAHAPSAKTQLLEEKRSILSKMGNIDYFIRKSNAAELGYKNITIQKVMNSYFNNEPPFGNKKKKMEFPDAIALYSLEQWRRNNKIQLVVAISLDNDWKAFAAATKPWVIKTTVKSAVEIIMEFHEHKR